MDEIDRANRRVEQELQIALAQQKARAAQTQAKRDDCESCGEPLPELRRQMQARYCVHCQAEFERRQALKW